MAHSPSPTGSAEPASSFSIALATSRWHFHCFKLRILFNCENAQRKRWIWNFKPCLRCAGCWWKLTRRWSRRRSSKKKQQRDERSERKGEKIVIFQEIIEEPINVPLYRLKLDNVDKCNKLISTETATLLKFLLRNWVFYITKHVPSFVFCHKNVWVSWF